MKNEEKPRKCTGGNQAGKQAIKVKMYDVNREMEA